MKLSSISQRRATRYAYLHNNAPALQSWRTPARTRTLVTIYFLGLGVAVSAWILMLLRVLGMGSYLIVYIAALLMSMIAFTMLRCTIDAKDLAPLEELDGYEREVMATWHSRSHRVFETVLLVGGFAFILASTFFHQYFHPAALGVSAGLYMLFTYLAVGTLPAVGFAATFNTNPHDQPEELF